MSTALAAQLSRSEVREVLEDVVEEGFRLRDAARRIRARRILRKQNLFERFYEKTTQEFGKYLTSRNVVSVAASGELFKFFLEWLQDGGWEIIAEIIKMFF